MWRRYKGERRRRACVVCVCSMRECEREAGTLQLWDSERWRVSVKSWSGVSVCRRGRSGHTRSKLNTDILPRVQVIPTHGSEAQRVVVLHPLSRARWRGRPRLRLGPAPLRLDLHRALLVEGVVAPMRRRQLLCRPRSGDRREVDLERRCFWRGGWLCGLWRVGWEVQLITGGQAGAERLYLQVVLRQWLEIAAAATRTESGRDVGGGPRRRRGLRERDAATEEGSRSAGGAHCGRWSRLDGWSHRDCAWARRGERTARATRRELADG